MNNEKNTEFVISTLNTKVGNINIPMGIKVYETGKYTIDFSEFNFTNHFVYLIDNNDNSEILLSNKSSFIFNINKGIDNNRFELKLEENIVPKLQLSLEDKVEDIYKVFNFTIPKNTFTDINVNDKLAYTANIVGQANLPSWLTFNPETLSFSGTPTEEQDLDIQIKATDMLDASSSDVFNFKVYSLAGINVNDIYLVVSPNPNTGRFNVILQKEISAYQMDITNIMGQTIYKNNFTNNGINEINLSTQPAGVYFMEIKFNQSTVTRKIIIE